MVRQKVVNGVYYDLTPEEEAELEAQEIGRASCRERV